MNSTIFNVCLAVGWVLIMVGVSGLHSVWAGLLTGGTLLVGLTLLMAFKVGVRATQTKGAQNVSE
jgi:hypothetical protein